MNLTVYGLLNLADTIQCGIAIISQDGTENIHSGWDKFSREKVAFLLIGKLQHMAVANMVSDENLDRLNLDLRYRSPENTEFLLVARRQAVSKVVFTNPFRQHLSLSVAPPDQTSQSLVAQ